MFVKRTIGTIRYENVIYVGLFPPCDEDCIDNMARSVINLREKFRNCWEFSILIKFACAAEIPVLMSLMWKFSFRSVCMEQRGLSVSTFRLMTVHVRRVTVNVFRQTRLFFRWIKWNHCICRFKFGIYVERNKRWFMKSQTARERWKYVTWPSFVPNTLNE